MKRGLPIAGPPRATRSRPPDDEAKQGARWPMPVVAVWSAAESAWAAAADFADGLASSLDAPVACAVADTARARDGWRVVTADTPPSVPIVVVTGALASQVDATLSVVVTAGVAAPDWHAEARARRPSFDLVLADHRPAVADGLGALLGDLAVRPLS